MHSEHVCTSTPLSLGPSWELEDERPLHPLEPRRLLSGGSYLSDLDLVNLHRILHFAK